jgi:plasmid stabilization system protein ParE
VSKYYVVSKGGGADLIDIARYTTKKWGAAQCRAYISQLEQGAEAIAKGEGTFKEVGGLYPELRVALCGKHYIFCLPRLGDLPLIVAIFHERMDIMARLKNRLS